MSWSFEFTGTIEAVSSSTQAECDKLAKKYEGKPEGDDILSVKARIVALLAALDTSDGTNGANVRANGSHATRAKGIATASFACHVQGLTLKL